MIFNWKNIISMQRFFAHNQWQCLLLLLFIVTGIKYHHNKYHHIKYHYIAHLTLDILNSIATLGNCIYQHLQLGGNVCKHFLMYVR